MIEKNNVQYRNLTEQVLKNKEDIAEIKESDIFVNGLGIKVLGRYDTIEDIPEAEYEYGDAFMIGTETPYSMYVWSRANPDAGQDEDYWMNIGPISVVGPQGPQGERGEQGPQGIQGIQGPTGQAAGFGVCTAAIAESQFGPGVSVGTSGPDTAKSFNFTFYNIKGPKGDDGDPGPTGPRGDPGGFIRIVGSLSTPEQLPEITEWNNTAYLVGNTKNLYIMEGEHPEDLHWEDIGPINVATYVTVNGEFVGTWDSDTKLDKTTSAKKIYATTAFGGQTTLAYSDGTDSAAIAQRDNNGSVVVPNPVTNTEAANKAYVDTALSGKQNTLTAGTGIDITNNVISATGGGDYVYIDKIFRSNITTQGKELGLTDSSLTQEQYNLIWGDHPEKVIFRVTSPGTSVFVGITKTFEFKYCGEEYSRRYACMELNNTMKLYATDVYDMLNLGINVSPNQTTNYTCALTSVKIALVAGTDAFNKSTSNNPTALRYATSKSGAESFAGSDYTILTRKAVKDYVDEKSTVSVSNTGTATDEVGYITIDGVEKKIAGGGSVEGDVFIAEYNTTTTQELWDADDAGKAIFCKYSTSAILPLCGWDNSTPGNTKALFYAYIENTSATKIYANWLLKITLDANDTWSYIIEETPKYHKINSSDTVNSLSAGKLSAEYLTDGTTTKTMTEVLAGGGGGDYLPLSGGTMTGNINFNTSGFDHTPLLTVHDEIDQPFYPVGIHSIGNSSSSSKPNLAIVTKELHIESKNGINPQSTFKFIPKGLYSPVLLCEGEQADLGNSSYKWKTLYATNLSDGTTTKTMTEVLSGGGSGGNTYYQHMVSVKFDDIYYKFSFISSSATAISSVDSIPYGYYTLHSADNVILGAVSAGGYLSGLHFNNTGFVKVYNPLMMVWGSLSSDSVTEL